MQSEQLEPSLPSQKKEPMFPYNNRAAHGLLSKLGLAFFAAAALAITSVSFAAPGDLYVTELTSGSVVVYSPTGVATTFDTGLISPQGIAVDQAKNLYVVDAGDGTAGAGILYKYSIPDGSSSKTPFRTGLDNPQGVALDGTDLLVSEKGANRVLRIPLDGGTPTIFMPINAPLGLDSRGINDGTGLYRFVAGLSDDLSMSIVRQKSPTGTNTDFDFSASGSRSIAMDETGNAFVSTDTGDIFDIEVSTGTITTFSSGFTQPTGMDFRPAKFGGDTDRVGFLYVADTSTGVISQISGTGTVTTFVSGAAGPNYLTFEVNAKPVVVTGIASDIADTSATVNGTVNPNGSETTYHFEYGTTTAYGSTTPDTSAGSGFESVAVSEPLTGLTPGTVYHFRVTATNSGGTVTGADGTFTTFDVPPPPTPTPTPIVVTGNATSVTDTTATLNGTVNPSGAATTYQFEYGVTTAYGSTTTSTSAGSGFTAVPVSADLTGLTSGTLYHFRLTATNGGGTANGADGTFTTAGSTVAGKALNISTRVDVESGDNVGIGGFIITGTGSKLVVVRGIGPSLAPGVSGALADPLLELHDSTGAIIATNDNWMSNSVTDQATLTDNNLAPTNDLESAIVATLPADGATYTAIIKGSSGETGVALVEAYDLDNPGGSSELANISTRGLVGTEANVLIGGVIVGPDGGLDASVVVRAIGPSLPVPNPLINPVLELHSGNGDLIVANDDWQDDSVNAAKVTAAGLAPTEPAESAIFANLIAGLYTAIVSGKDATTGVGLVEVYHVPAQP